MTIIWVYNWTTASESGVMECADRLLHPADITENDPIDDGWLV